MPTGLLARKLGMTRIFAEDGRWIPVTLLQAGPCTVVQRKTLERDGYDAVQLGFEDKKTSACTSPYAGHFVKRGLTPMRNLREFTWTPGQEPSEGEVVNASIFKVGDRVDVTGISKGHGFAGVHRRHGFRGGPATHGSMFHRAPGSIGQAADPSKVFKGLRMPGHMGHQQTTTQNLEIVLVDTEKNLVAVKGSVPGKPGGLIELKRTVKGAD